MASRPTTDYQPINVAAAVQPASLWRRIGYVLTAYFELTKPRIAVLLLITTLAAMLAAPSPWPAAPVVLATILGGYLAAGGASALNNFFDRDIDQLMRRTRRRPLPSHRVAPASALVFGAILGALAFAIFAVFVNLLAAALSLFGLLFYVFVYTTLLKRATPQNIVIGGAAGGIPPLVGWAAATGTLSLPAFLLFAIIFFWTPPHFWSLALINRDDYEAAGVPMLPIVAGEGETTRQILLYSVVLVAISALLVAVGGAGPIYLAAALGFGVGLISNAAKLVRAPGIPGARKTFVYSNVYLALLFLALVVDRLVLR